MNTLNSTQSLQATNEYIRKNPTCKIEIERIYINVRNIATKGGFGFTHAFDKGVGEVDKSFAVEFLRHNGYTVIFDVGQNTCSLFWGL